MNSNLLVETATESMGVAWAAQSHHSSQQSIIDAIWAAPNEYCLLEPFGLPVGIVTKE